MPLGNLIKKLAKYSHIRKLAKYSRISSFSIVLDGGKKCTQIKYHSCRDPSPVYTFLKLDLKHIILCMETAHLHRPPPVECPRGAEHGNGYMGSSDFSPTVK